MIRKASINDIDAVYSLICQMEDRKLPYDIFKKIYAEQVDSDNYYCLAYEDDGRIIGVLNMRFEYQLHHCERIAEIMEFAVEYRCRQRGLGKALLIKAAIIAKNNGCEQIEAASSQLRTNAHRFYESTVFSNTHFKFSRRLSDIE